MAKQQIIRLFNTTPSEIDNEFVSEDYDNKEPDTKGESLGTGPVLIYQKNSSFNGSSSNSSPAIAQKPPIGNALIEYKVSPFFFFHNNGPIPNAYSLQSIFARLAKKK